jgi:hypothetical protein
VNKVAEKGKTQKQIVRDCLAGANGGPRLPGGFPAGWSFRRVALDRSHLPLKKGPVSAWPPSSRP